MAKNNSLTQIDWIMAGFRALVVGGAQAIKVEAIAKGLKVSKGSFYWHFKDVASLKNAMLEHWKQIATHNIIAGLSTSGDDSSSLDAKAQLKQLVQVATSDISEPYGGSMVESAIRDWARYDENVAAILSLVDTTRLKFVRELFEESGVCPTKSNFFANILYAGLIGLEQLSSLDTVNPVVELTELLDLIFQSDYCRK